MIFIIITAQHNSLFFLSFFLSLSSNPRFGSASHSASGYGFSRVLWVGKSIRKEGYSITGQKKIEIKSEPWSWEGVEHEHVRCCMWELLYIRDMGMEPGIRGDGDGMGWDGFCFCL